jgi:glycosyltransferase involved in cell wall biosynthesis
MSFESKKKLSIVIFSHTPNLDGAGRSLLDMLRCLQSFELDCHVVLPSRGPLYDRMQYLPHSSILAPELLASRWLWVATHQNEDIFDDSIFDHLIHSIQEFLIPAISALKPDFIFTQTIASPWGAVCAEMMGVKHVLCPREYGRAEHGVHFSYKFNPTMRALCNTSDQLFCITNDVCNFLFEDGFNKNISTYHSIKLEVIDHAQELDFIDRTLLNIAQLGNIAKGKGQLDLIHAVIALSKKGIPVRCYFVGVIADKNYKKILDRTINESGFGERFFFIKNTQNPHLIISVMDVVVSCSIFEGLGRTLFEAILLNVPIIYANSGGPAEVFRDGIHGLSYEPGNFEKLAYALMHTVSQKIETNKRILAAKNYIETLFTDSNFGGLIYNKLLELLDEPLCRGVNKPVLHLLKSRLLL